MDYEKKNKDAISTIKQALRQLATNGVPVGNMIEAIKDIEEKYAENEEEKIRNAIIDHIRHSAHNIPADKFNTWIAWLEKQGEQKPADEIKPKFNVGDYIERKDGLGCHAKIIFVGGNVYGCEKLIYSEDSSPFFEFMFKNQDEFQISSDFKQKPADKVEPKFHEGDWITIK